MTYNWIYIYISGMFSYTLLQILVATRWGVKSSSRRRMAECNGDNNKDVEIIWLFERCQ